MTSCPPGPPRSPPLQPTDPSFPSARIPSGHGRPHSRLHVSHNPRLPVSDNPGLSKWQRESAEGTVEVVHLNLPTHTNQSVNDHRRNRIVQAITPATAAIHGRKFRRLVADRDVRPEPPNEGLQLAPDGSGATNIIRRYIVAYKPEMRESLIQEDLLKALSFTFGEDGDFTNIEVRLHEDKNHWEVFLGEPQKGLVPLSRSGSGLKTVILVLLNLLVVPEIDSSHKRQYLFAFEELENNLHPALLRRLFQYLADFVEREECILFLTSHSSVALDFFGPREDTQIIHASHDGTSGSTKTVVAHFDHVGLLTELGARPSDLLQANGVIWLEGPSDRFYFNRFVELFSDGTLREGRDYQCDFYGGSNLANSTFAAPESSDDTFANLLRLNHNIAVICDGDRTAASGQGSRIKGRVQRIKQEVEEIPGAFLWITEAKEIENYIPGSVWSRVYDMPDLPDPEKYNRFPTGDFEETDFVLKHIKRKSFDKVDFAMKAVDHMTRDGLASRFEMQGKMESLVKTIKTWNK